MRSVDLSNAAELMLLTDLLRKSTRATDPAEMMSALGPWFGTRGRYDMLVSVSRRGLGPGEFKITRVIDNPKEMAQLAQHINPWRDWSKIPAQRGGLIGSVLQHDNIQLLIDLDVRDDDVLGILVRDMRALLAIPNYDSGEAINWALFFRRSPAGWSDAELVPALLEANLLGMATRNLVARRDADEANRRLSDQFEQLARVQRALLPEKLPDIPGYHIGSSYLTSEQAGGDYYDFLHLPGDRLGILIADVSGHGAAAATVMAMLRGILHCYAGDGASPAEVMLYCNEKLAAARLDGTFTTAFFGVLTPATGHLRFARFGHNPPRIRRADSSIAVLDAAGTLPLGLVHPVAVEDESATLQPGDTLILYTDGITESFTPVKATGDRDMFGTGRLDATLTDCSGAPECVINHVHQALYQHTGAMRRDDDQTLVVIQRDPGRTP